MMNDLEVPYESGLGPMIGLEIRCPYEPAERRQIANICGVQARLTANEIILYEFLEAAANYFKPGPAIVDNH